VAVQRICVVGAGAIGSLFAAHLAQVAETWVLARREEHAAAIAGQGLQVSGKADFTARPRATIDPASVPAPDLVIVAVKAIHLAETARILRGRFPGAVVMCVQNGLGAEEAIGVAGSWPLISAVTFMSGIRHDDRHVEYELDAPTWLGPYAPTQTSLAFVEEVHGLLVASGLRAEALPDLVPAQWSKLIFNAAVNVVAALTDLPHIDAFAQQDELGDLGHVLRALIDEGKAVAAARGIALHDDPWEMNLRAVSHGASTGGGGHYAHLPSMLEDVRAQRPTEVDFISGAIVREAGRAGVPAPLNAMVWRLVRGKERSWDWAREHETEVAQT
jgi:2-dehydropantoate 2-reductase